MTREKKTVRVEDILAPMNRALAAKGNLCHIQDMTPDQAWRAGIASAIETVLQHANRYRGFSYMDVDHSQSPPLIPDETRRQYY